MSGSSYDAVVVGAGPNGLVAANHLLDAGWSVLVIEAQDEPGGAVRSDREVHPDFVSDTFSACYPFAVESRAMRSLELERYGLTWCHAPAVLGHPLPDGRWAVLHHAREDTAASMEALGEGDGDRWLELCATWDRIGGPLVDAFLTPFPPLLHGSRLATRLPGAGGTEVIRTLLSPVASLARRFSGPGPGLLLTGNAGHADFTPTAPGSGAFGLLMSMMAQTVGFPSPEGGAGQLTGALVRRLEERGGALVTGSPVTRVVVEGGRAVAVHTAHGEQYAARRAVLADVGATSLFGDLLEPEHVPRAVRRGMAAFEIDPGTVKVDWALSGPIPWRGAPDRHPGVVHVADSVEEITQTLTQVAAGSIPEKPFMLAGQMTTTDASRSPVGTESLWAYAHVPQPEQTLSDAGGDDLDGRWRTEDCERFAERMQARIERLAPGFGERVVARRVMGPHEIEARDANLVGGAINGGTSQLHQDLLFRPVPSMHGRAETGVPGLYLASASAHPGGGVHGAPGASAARAAVWHDRLAPLTRLLRRR